MKYAPSKCCILVSLILSFLSCKENKMEQSYLGIVDLTVTASAEALPSFERGLLLLHSFEYEDARESFKEAQRFDGNMAMACWGEAMTYNHSLWNEQDYDKGKLAADKAHRLLDEINYTPLEKDFIKSLQWLYEAGQNKIDRDKNYADYLERLYNKYPDNHEVAAFYALSLLGSSENGRNEGLYDKGAKIAQGIIDENPSHPGALHYLIHSYDDPDHAHLALSAADAYAKVAPDASHALHMPSHIYVAKGMWDEVVSSNIASYQASLHRMVDKNLDNDARGYHAFHWLQYGYLQLKNVEEARKMVMEMQKFMQEKPSKRARSHMVFLKGTYLIESDDWDSDVSDIQVDIKDLNVTIRSQYLFLEGMLAYRYKEINKIDSIIATMKNDYQRESYLVSNEGVQLCSGVTRDQASKSDLLECKIRQLQVQGLLADLYGDAEEAERNFQQSITLFNSNSYSYGPPMIQKPPQELYADWLVKQKRIQEANQYYQKVLQNAPRRTRVIKALDSPQEI